MKTWESVTRQAVLSLNSVLTRYNNWNHERRAHLFAARNLLADEWMMQDAVEQKQHQGIKGTTHYRDIKCGHPGGTALAELLNGPGVGGEERGCQEPGKNRCRSCGFLYCLSHALEYRYSGAHVPSDEEYTAHKCDTCGELDPYRVL